MKISIARPCLGDAEKRAVLDVLESGQLIQGPRVAAFEERFARLHGARHGIAVSNGSTALVVALMAHGVGPGDEVIVPSFTFFATASAVLAVGAQPVFADIDPVTYNLSVDAAEQAISSRTRAILPVHLYGCPADAPGFRALCDARGLALLEDAAQAHLASIEGRAVGTWGTGCFSFHASKNMTTGEGGMVLTSDDAVAERARLVRNQGMRTKGLHELIGCNFRMTEMCAAIGLAQIERLPAWTEQRIANAERLSRQLSSVSVPRVPAGACHVFHQFTIRVPRPFERDRVAFALRDRGIDARIYYERPIHLQPALEGRLRERPVLPETERAAREVLSLPIHPGLSVEDLDYVGAEVNLALSDVAVADSK